MRLNMDCKATVKIGDYSRGGKTRGDHRAADHDMGCEEKHTPFGVVNEDSGSLHLSFGSSAKTSDFIIDSLYAWWERQAPEERARVTHLQIKADNGPESNGRRTQFLKRMVQFADHIGRSIRLLYYPPYHSKYNPVERCWGILEKHGIMEQPPQPPGGRPGADAFSGKRTLRARPRIHWCTRHTPVSPCDESAFPAESRSPDVVPGGSPGHERR
ncbi:MAG: hypothetical protein IPK44_13960 [Candidatus Accumulibacter sp.]|nr:hypothetical protein [Accumulibacter sp.]